ncbi:hypothetical protein BAUCODRAFT_37356 [Baudoinia panamericana UAMH 10762]|uniref:F-box domain-containing protein n=1 Tax=Baudoinia panamericana (strain UAMH 10762) TaxID=717646 RepID=M2N4K4_BAUPA|nr:uncharacterized protein BAUCODRAFT_37356 [Baudoinia panamericana UAMH 10762]EMC93655.1 hypothetical protein BAUCODRAFT_37356 [Baudoinia panamericana UAMH 10762]
MQSPKLQADTAPFRLLNLPAEIWTQIIALAVIYKDPITITRSSRVKDQQELVRQPAITRTCRVLRLEALPLFYRHNTFEGWHVHHVQCPRDWLVAIGDANRKAMGSFRFCAQFSASFWEGKFARMGVKVVVEECGSCTQPVCQKEKDANLHGLKDMIVRFV